MKTYEYQLRIAAIEIRLLSDVPLNFSERYRLFYSNTGFDADVIFRLHTGFPLMDSMETITRTSTTELLKNETNLFRILKESGTGQFIRITSWDDENFDGYDVFFPSEQYPMENINPLNFVEMSEFLIRFQGVILHSAVIRYHGKGILFTAPSGTGKSTQAALWEKFYGAEILNGDRGILKQTDSGYQVYGSPYAGSSGIYKNESAEVKAIVVIRQAKRNQICRLDKKAAYILLFSELSVSAWSKKTIELQAEWILKFLDCVPVYQLDCIPDQSAATCLYERLKKDDEK